jgi:hypothetical protein
MGLGETKGFSLSGEPGRAAFRTKPASSSPDAGPSVSNSGSSSRPERPWHTNEGTAPTLEESTGRPCGRPHITFAAT